MNIFGRCIRYITRGCYNFDSACEKSVKKSLALWEKGGKINAWRAKRIWRRNREKYCCDFYPGVHVGNDLRIEHSQGILIGKTTIIGDDVRIYQGVNVIAKTVGDQELIDSGVRRHALIGNHVTLCAGCTIIGPIEIGDNCLIGARAIVTHDIPPNSVVIGTNRILKNVE